ncbi:MAG: hypothetical protein ABH808_02150 [Candidatus Kuenenbacteria bacterium]
MQTYIFKISLLYSSPKIGPHSGPEISREIEILENSSLYKLAETIIDAYNFDFDHCFGFFSEIDDRRCFDSEKQYELFTDLIKKGEDIGIEPTGAGSVEKTKIKEVWQNIGDKMMFLFDYGDNWQFVVELVGFSKKDIKKKYPRIMKKKGRAPKQY